MRNVTRRNLPYAFTLIELLVVVSIIALLIAILLPSLGRAREQAKQTVCSTRMRSWGQGFHIYADTFDNSLPNDGDSNNETSPVGRWDDLGLWFNAIPAAIGRPSYNDLQLQQPGGAVPAPHVGLPRANEDSMFICPSVATPIVASSTENVINGYYQAKGYEPTFTPSTRDMLLCYGYNSQLRSLTYGTTAATYPYTRKAGDISRFSQLDPGANLVLLAEKRVDPGELTSFSNSDLSALGVSRTQNCTQTKVAPKRTAARHKLGGNFCFADGHVEWLPFKIVNAANTVNSQFPVQYNQPGVILWTPQ